MAVGNCNHGRNRISKGEVRWLTFACIQKIFEVPTPSYLERLAGRPRQLLVASSPTCTTLARAGEWQGRERSREREAGSERKCLKLLPSKVRACLLYILLLYGQSAASCASVLTQRARHHC